MSTEQERPVAPVIENEPNAEVEVIRNEDGIPKNYWEEHGFEKSIATVCANLEMEPEKFMLSSNIRQLIETVQNADSVEYFDRYENGELIDFIHEIRQNVPQVEREVMNFIGQLTRARAVKNNEIDFI